MHTTVHQTRDSGDAREMDRRGSCRDSDSDLDSDLEAENAMVRAMGHALDMRARHALSSILEWQMADAISRDGFGSSMHPQVRERICRLGG